MLWFAVSMCFGVLFIQFIYSRNMFGMHVCSAAGGLSCAELERCEKRATLLDATAVEPLPRYAVPHVCHQADLCAG